MSYDETLKKLGTNTGNVMKQILAKLEAGEIDRATARDLWAVILETAGQQGQTLGAVAFDAQSRAATGAGPVLTDKASKIAGPIVVTQSRAVKALNTIMEGPPEQLGVRIVRLGESSPVQRAQEEFGQRMSKDIRIEGWTRGVEVDSCQLCKWWNRGGTVWPKTHPMPTHNGCTCYQVPGFKNRTAGKWQNEQDGRAPRREDRGGGLKPKRR